MKKGFTLIELLVVVAIIGVLASIVLGSLGSARANARDAARKSDLRQIRNALELYYLDNGSYPMVNRWAYSTGNTNWTQFETLMAPYINLPVDPTNSASGPWTTGNYSYAYGSSLGGQVYDLVAQVENTNDSAACINSCAVYHQGESSYLPGAPWCSACSGGGPWSPYIIADH